ncbi:MAG: GIY-YIG nuclease family protein, partial [Thalassolituus sp.]
MTARKESDESWFLYLIETSKGALYCGVTTDVERRFKEHSAGGVRGARALKGKGPLTLRYQVRAGDRSAALKAEYRVKQLRDYTLTNERWFNSATEVVAYLNDIGVRSTFGKKVTVSL